MSVSHAGFALCAALLGQLAGGPAIDASLPPGATMAAVSPGSEMLTDIRQVAVHGALSPDGRTLVYSVDEDGGHAALWQLEIGSGKPPARLTRGEGRDDFPRFTADGTALVFSASRGGPSKIHELVLPSGRESALTDGDGEDLHPVVSHSGRYVAFASNRTGNYDIWVLDRLSGKLHRITDDPAPEFHPAWSPDDKELAWTSGAEGRFDIVARRLVKGAPVRRITHGPSQNAHPDWSRRGLIAYDADLAGVVRVMVVDPSQPDRAVAATSHQSQEEFPRWSGDGTRIVYQARENSFSTIKEQSLPWTRSSPILGDPRAPMDALGQAGGVTGVPPLPEAPPPIPGVDAAMLAGAGGAPVTVTQTQGWGVSGSMAVPPAGAGRGGAAFAVAMASGTSGPAGTSGIAGAAGMSGGEPVVVLRHRQTAGAPAPGYVPQSGPQAMGDANGSGFHPVDYFPHEEPGGVPVQSAIAVVFALELDRGQDPEPLVNVMEGATPLRASVVFNPLLRRLDITPVHALAPGSAYTVTVRAGLRAADGTPMERDVSWTFHTAADPRKVRWSGRVVPEQFAMATTRPAHDARNVPLDTTVTIELTHSLDTDTVGPDSVRLLDSQRQPVPGEVKAPRGDLMLVLKPYQRLLEGRAYTVVLSPRLRSRAHEPLPERERRFVFTTVYGTPFSVVTFAPGVIARQRQPITIRFNRPVAPDSLVRGEAALVLGDRRWPGRLTMGATQDTVIFEAYSKPEEGGRAQLYLPIGMTDQAGNPLKAGLRMVVAIRPGQGQGQGQEQGVVARAVRKMGRPPEPDQASSLLWRHGMTAESRPLAGIRMPRGIPPMGQEAQVPAWATAGLVRFARKGFLGDDVVPGEIPGVTRYRAATLVETARRSAAVMPAQDARTLRRLEREFGAERAALGLAPPSDAAGSGRL